MFSFDLLLLKGMGLGSTNLGDRVLFLSSCFTGLNALWWKVGYSFETTLFSLLSACVFDSFNAVILFFKLSASSIRSSSQ